MRTPRALLLDLALLILARKVLIHIKAHLLLVVSPKQTLLAAARSSARLWHRCYTMAHAAARLSANAVT